MAITAFLVEPEVTNAAMIRKALALAKVVSQNANSDHTITVAPTNDGKPAVKISLAG